MELAYLLTGTAPRKRRFQVSASNAYPGVPYLIPASGTAGVVLATTTGAADVVGCSLDAVGDRFGTVGTYQTAQQSDNSDPARLVTLIINPDAVWRARMSGGATEGTALSARTVSTASTSGLAVTTGDDWSSPTFDEGHLWGYEGANAGIVRKITSVSNTAATLTVALPADTAVNDTFLYCPFTPMQGITVQFTTNLQEADASIAVGTGAGFKPIELICNDLAGDGKNKSYVLMIPTDHFAGPRPT